MKGLYVFHEADQILPLLVNPPEPQGNKQFFLDMYGEPDGLEGIKFGALARWPRVSAGFVQRKKHSFELIDL